MASRARLKNRSDYEYAILWENVRADYFANVGDQQGWSMQEILAGAGVAPGHASFGDQLEQSSGDPLADAGWIPSDEARLS